MDLSSFASAGADRHTGEPWQVQTHGAVHECSARPEGRPTDRLLLMSTSANGADRKLDTSDHGQRLGA
jgi:hypothetical protein